MIHEKIKYPCNVCHKSFTQQGDAKKHFESIHAEVKYSCNQCDKEFARQD